MKRKDKVRNLKVREQTSEIGARGKIEKRQVGKKNNRLDTIWK